MKNFNGNILFLDRSDINTDEIIPARYLTEIDKAALKPHLLEDLCLDGFIHKRDIPGKTAIVTRANFGCGSSREHAPWALEVNGINLVIGESFARIFRQNMYNCGMMALEMPETVIQEAMDTWTGTAAAIAVDMDAGRLTFSGSGKTATFPFTLPDFDRALLEAGGWVDYADARY